jgi:nucleoside phosphorylase
LGDAIAKHAGSPVRGSLATTAGITTSDELARKLAQSKCATENLEGLAVGLACEKERVAFAALLLVTNQVGEQGREQWLQNHQAAAERGAAILLEWIDAGAAGLPAS